jgi:hypothetical protein
VVDHHSGVCDDAVFRNLRYVGRGHDEHCICPFLSGFVVALTHPAKVFSERCHPNFCSGWIFHELVIATDGRSGDWVNHRLYIMLKISGGGRVMAKLEGYVVSQILALIIKVEVIDGVLAHDLCVA